MKTTQNIFSKSVFTAGVLFGLLLVFSPAFSLTTGAQDDPAGLQPLQETGLSTTDPRIISQTLSMRRSVTWNHHDCAHCVVDFSG